jgi:hypothetical protein
MTGKMDLSVDRGATFKFSFVWGTITPATEDDPEVLVPYDLSDATAVLSVWGNGRTDEYVATIDNDSRVWLELTAKETIELTGRPEFAVVVTYASGDVRHALEGHLLLNHEGVTRV